MSAHNSKVAHDLVSVVVPIYNVGETLDECLASLEAQTYRNLEIICVNDGSTDGSEAIARRHAAHDSRIAVVSKPNEGYGASCNRGIAMAQGVWIGIVEPDDVVAPTFLEELLAWAAQHGGVAAVDVVRCGYWREFGGAGGSLERIACPYLGRVSPQRQPFAIGEGAELLLHHPAIWAGLYRRGFLKEKHIRFVEAPGAGWVDNPFLVETLCQTDRIAYLDRALYTYRERDLDDARFFAARQPLVPLTRWNEMMDAAERAGAVDRRVAEALTLRGVNYALITVGAVGLENPEVAVLVRTSMVRLSREAVMGSAAISPAGKRLYAKALGQAEPHVNPLPHYGHLAREALYRIRRNGLAFALKTARARLADRE